MLHPDASGMKHGARSTPENCLGFVSHARLQAEHLPAYAPELNPVEGVWCEWKAHRLANHAAEGLDALAQLAIFEAIDMRRSQELLRGCVGGTGLPIRLH